MCCLDGLVMKLYIRQEVLGLSARCEVNFLSCHDHLVSVIGPGTKDLGSPGLVVPIIEMGLKA